MNWTLFWQLVALMTLLYLFIHTMIKHYYKEKSFSIILTETQVSRILTQSQPSEDPFPGLPKVPTGPAPGGADLRWRL